MKTLWNKLRHPTERTKLIISVTAVGLLLMLAALLPLTLRQTVPEPSEETAALREERTALFARYWTEKDPAVTAEAAVLTEEASAACHARMASLIDRFLPDQALSSRAPTGQEMLHLSDGTGTGTDYCRMWLEAKGDWQNWLDVCIEPETGLLFYFYLSRECLDHRELYQDVLDPGLDAAGVAEKLAEELGWTLRYLSEDGEGTVAVFRAGEETLCYRICCTVYGTLLDVRICCL